MAASRGLTPRWWLAVVAVAVAAAASAAASRPAEAAVTFTNAAGVCQQLVGCHCQQLGALHCQLSDSAELRAVTGRLPTLPDITLVDLVLRDLSTLPGGLFSGASLQALLLSGSKVQSLPADLLTGLETSLRALGLGENQLLDVPTAALTGLTSLERLDLSGNQLRQVRADALPALGSLAELNLAENELSKLDVDAFTTLIALRTLWLEGNRLNVTQLSSGALRPLVSLERLSLDHNLLAGPLTFQLTSALPTDLTTLSLADNNLTSISSGALTPLAALTSLDLSGNRIDVIDSRAFAGLPRLRTLRLDGNHIVTLPAGGLSGLKALTELDLSRNSLQALTEDVLTPLPALRRLLLRNNDLIQLDGQLLRALPALKKVDIAENSLHCDCRLRELANYLSDSSAWLEDEDVRQITCATPTALENAPLVDLKRDQLTCREPPTGPPDSDSDSDSDPDPDSDDVIRLESAQLTPGGDGVRLRWSVAPSLSPYRCDQVALASRPDSTQPCEALESTDPTELQVALRSVHLSAGERYQFCVTLRQLLSGVELPLPSTCQWVELTPAPATLPRLESLSAEVASGGRVAAHLSVTPEEGRDLEHCAVTVVVLGPRGPLSAVEVSCAVRRVTLWAAVGAGTVRVCSTEPYRSAIAANSSQVVDAGATVASSAPPLRRCVQVHSTEGAGWWQAAAAGAAALAAVGLLLGWVLYRWRRSRCSPGRAGRTRLESSDSAPSEFVDAGESDEDEETDLPV